MNNDYPLARAWLNRIPMLMKEIRRNEARIENLRSACTSTTAQVSDMPRASSPNNHQMEELLARIMDLENDVATSKAEIERLRQEMLLHLNEWVEPEQAVLLTRRYADMLSWEDISDELNCTKRRVYQIHRDSLELLDERLNRIQITA